MASGLYSNDGAMRVMTVDGAGNSAGAITTATHTNVASANADTTFLAANTARKPGSTIANESTAILYLKLGTGASATSYWMSLGPTASSIAPVARIPDGYTGVVDGFWAAANGNARVTEMT